MVKLLKYSVLILLISACESDPIGPCVHIYEEPILTIQAVTSAESGNEIGFVEIFDVTIDDVSRNPSYLTQEASENTAVKDSLLECTVPCGFGVEEGSYTFSVKADGFKDSTFTRSAKYNKSKGGCPSSSSAGTKMSFSLNSEQM